MSLPRLLDSVRGVFDAAGPAGLTIDTRTVPLSAVGEHWDDVNSVVRPVFTMHGD